MLLDNDPDDNGSESPYNVAFVYTTLPGRWPSMALAGAVAAPWNYGRPYNVAASSCSRRRIQGISFASAIKDPGPLDHAAPKAVVRPSQRSFVSRFRSVFSFLSLQFKKI